MEPKGVGARRLDSAQHRRPNWLAVIFAGAVAFASQPLAGCGPVADSGQAVGIPASPVPSLRGASWRDVSLPAPPESLEPDAGTGRLIVRLKGGTVVALSLDETPVQVQSIPADALLWSSAPDGVRFRLENGELVVVQSDVEARLPLDAPPAAKPKRLAGGLVVPSRRTTRYPHGALGDDVEAAGLAFVTLSGTPRLGWEVQLPEFEVFEGHVPIVGDLNGDGQDEVVMTVSDSKGGARLVAFDSTGRQMAESPAIGQGFRWRHAIAIGKFGPGGEPELAAVRTPHIGGVAEYFRMEGERLTLVAERPGVSSHQLGSSELGMAIALEPIAQQATLIVPTPDFEELVILRRGEGTAEVTSRLALGGRLATNVYGLAEPGGGTKLAAGRSDSVLRVWTLTSAGGQVPIAASTR